MEIARRSLVLGAAGLAAGRVTAAGHDDAPLPEGAESRIASLNGIRLHYVVAGSGPPVVLLHGWPQTWFAWAGTMARLAPHFRVIAPDLRGLGRSQRTPDGYDKTTIAADIRALIAREASGRAAIVGHDMGGKAAYVLAHLHPESVAQLVLVDCLLPGTENADALHGGAWHYGFHAAPDFPEMLTRGRERDYIRAQIRAWSHVEGAPGEAAITEYARHYAGPGGMRAGFAYYGALPRDAALAASFSTKLTMPVLAIAGRHGVGTRLAEALRARTDTLSEVIVEGSGHFVPEEAPDVFCDALLRFLAG